MFAAAMVGAALANAVCMENKDASSCARGCYWMVGAKMAHCMGPHPDVHHGDSGCLAKKTEAECVSCRWSGSMCMADTDTCLQHKDAATCAAAGSCQWLGRSCMAASYSLDVCEAYSAQSACASCVWHGDHCMGTDGSHGAPCEGKSKALCVDCQWMNHGGMGMCHKSGAGGMDHSMDHSMHGGHSMQMYFESKESVTVLFKDWVTTNSGEYFAAMLLTFIFSVATPLLRYYAVTVSRGTLPLPVRAFIICIVFTLVYALMLVTMTFNVGLYFSVMFGLTVAWTIQESIELGKAAGQGTEPATDGAPEPAKVDCH